MLAILNEYNEFGDIVTKALKNDLSEKHSFVIVSKPFFQKTVNEVLDSFIDLYIQDLPAEKREEILNKIREIKAQYYQKFKALIPIQITQKAGVRFDTNQVVEEGLIDGLIKEIRTKGFTSSDVRKILVKDDELQLSIAKIKEMITENEETCKRNNAKAKDITTGRELTKKFYNDLEKENQVAILKPDTTLIKSAIEEKTDKKEEKKITVNSAVSVASSGAKTAPKQGVKKANVKGGSAQQRSAKKQQPAKSQKPAKGEQREANTPSATTGTSGFLYGSGTPRAPQRERDTVAANLLEELMEDDRRVVKDSSKISREETFVHTEMDEYIK